MNSSEIIKKVEETAALRRNEINEQMQLLMDDGKDCASCSGICCTFVKNSMMVTPVEALDVYIDLKNRSLITESLVRSIQETIRNFRLDRPVVGDGVRDFARRRYTCPFFNEDNPSCGISRLKKPYGCLSFNPRGCGIKDGENCASDQEILRKQESEHEDLEVELNQLVQSFLSIEWKKKNLPSAILEIIGKSPNP